MLAGQRLCVPQSFFKRRIAMTADTSFAKYLSQFLAEYLPHERNMSPNTIASYRDTFVQFINYTLNPQPATPYLNNMQIYR